MDVSAANPALDESEMSWPQMQRGERGQQGALSLSDLDLNRLAGVPRAHEIPSYGQGAESTAVSGNPESHGDVASWPADQPTSWEQEMAERGGLYSILVDPRTQTRIRVPRCAQPDREIICGRARPGQAQPPTPRTSNHPHQQRWRRR